MSLTATAGNGKSYDPIDAGMHQAVCYAVIDLGTQYNERFDSKQRKVLIMWEVPGVDRIKIEDGDNIIDLPRVISKQYTMSLHEKAILRQHLESWRNKAFTGQELLGFQIDALVGVNCVLQIMHKVSAATNNKYAFIQTITPIMKGVEKLTPERDTVVYEIESGPPPEGTPDWIKKIIMESEEMKELSEASDHMPNTDDIPDWTDDDDIPF